MTKLLSQAFSKASELPDHLQDDLAREMLADLEGEQKWESTLAESHDLLSHLASKAIEEDNASRTVAKGFDEI